MDIQLIFTKAISSAEAGAQLRKLANDYAVLAHQEAGAKPKKEAGPGGNGAIVDVEVIEDSDDDEDFGAPSKAKAKKVAAKKAAQAEFDEDEEIVEPDEDETPPPKKAAKSKKISLDDVNDACKAYAAENDRPAVLKILKKQFKVESVRDLKPDQYAAVIAAMEV